MLSVKNLNLLFAKGLIIISLVQCAGFFSLDVVNLFFVRLSFAFALS